MYASPLLVAVVLAPLTVSRIDPQPVPVPVGTLSSITVEPPIGGKLPSKLLTPIYEKVVLKQRRTITKGWIERIRQQIEWTLRDNGHPLGIVIVEPLRHGHVVFLRFRCYKSPEQRRLELRWQELRKLAVITDGLTAPDRMRQRV